MSSDSILAYQLSALNAQQRLRFYEAFAHSLTIVNRIIANDAEVDSDSKLSRLKNVNEILHRVVAAIHVIRLDPAKWLDEVTNGEIRRWVGQDESIKGDVGWAFKEAWRWRKRASRNLALARRALFCGRTA